MASKQELDRLATRAIEDDEFRAILEADPAKAAEALGIKLTPDQSLKLKKAAVEPLDGRQSKCGGGMFG